MTVNMEAESTPGKMDASMMDPGLMESNMEKEFIDRQLDKREEGIGRRASA